MHHQLAAVALGFIAVSVACASGRSESYGVSPSSEQASAPETASSATAARAQPDALGEVVKELSDSIWYVFHDQNDTHWFGSDGQGVYRVDGKTITRFTTKEGLSDDRIRGIQQHVPTGDILITTLGGVSKFDGQRFITLPVTDVDSPDEGWVLHADDVWLPWQPMQRGPYRYDGKTLYHLKFPKSPQEGAQPAAEGNLKRTWSPYEVYCTYKDRRGHMWFGTATLGIYRFDGKNVDWMYEDHLTNTPEGGSFGIRSIIEDRHGEFWFCNTQYRYDIQPHSDAGGAPGEITYSRKPGIDLSGTMVGEKFFYFMSIVEDERGHLWMAPYAGGVFEYDGTTLTHYPMKDADNNDITMFSIYRDRSGDLWVGTHEHGAYRFNGTVFEPFTP